ncbi:hypothetical protein H1D32_07160 [Anaerobacillus sp. CMMVII]|uniref:rhodanese-like domain-containing protein n=1 Tax=Anaerobacillus sp. CMMVII TaxID=2755588 RepID=UPI0021B70863|nr:rhodanese-like domain-containing protein [Anaerobacillus sp. CMMVII]MCT8137544.1 hypothetical protein [Anaerobacillus sp. CMMVII]
MKVYQKKFLILLSSIAAVFTLSACSDNNVTIDNIGPGKEKVEAPVVQLESDSFELLQQVSEEYLKNTSFESIMPGEVYDKIVFGSEEDFLIVDVRETEAFAAGNIGGSINIPYGVTADQNQIQNLPKDKKLIVVCYSGHTASQTAALWNMLGYNAIPMEYGMGGWTTAEGLGAAFVKQAFEFEVVKTNFPADGTNALPNIEAQEATNINELILAQSKKYLTSGKGAVIPAPKVLEKIEENATDVFLLDIRQESHYQNGHLEYAVNIPVETLASKDNLAKLPTDKQIIIIGYSATDASIANRVLNQLGYNAIPLHSGMRVWTSDQSVTGTNGIPVNSLGKYPIEKLNYNLEGEGAEASCS